MKEFLVDTSVVIDFLRRADKKDTLLSRIAESKLYISLITHTELFSGKSVWESKQTRAIVEEIVGGLVILGLDTHISEQAGYIKAHTRTTSLIDCIIGATALAYDLELVTLNKKDFELIDSLRLYPA